MNFPFKRSLVWPSLFAFLLALGFVAFTPGDIRKDAYEYDAIARSLVVDRSFSFEGRPTMLREPGYPWFRAAIYALGGNERLILIVQAMLASATVYFLGSSLEVLDTRRAWIATWSALFAYSYFSFASNHLSEVLAGFLCSLFIYFAVRQKIDSRFWWLTPVIGGFLCLTRFTFLFVVLAFLLWPLTFSDHQLSKKRIRQIFFALFLFLSTLAPWLLRNYLTFRALAITNRTGIQVYARVWKAQQPFRVLLGTYLSVLSGKVFSESLGFTPIINQQWEATRKRFFEIREERSTEAADALLSKEASRIFLSSPTVFIRAVFWTPLEFFRFIALPSPLSRDFSIEGMYYVPFQAGFLTIFRMIVLVVAHLIQLGWMSLFILSQWIGFRRYGWGWFPGLLVIATILAYLPFDAIIRYAVPLHPWMIASIVFIFWARTSTYLLRTYD